MRVPILLQIGADKEPVCLAKFPTNASKKRLGFSRIEIADRAAEKQNKNRRPERAKVESGLQSILV